ncbi:molybdopterin molybdenumtransferase [archaeon]|nr:molybdopterin molybdenumtransferase [archaeon]
MEVREKGFKRLTPVPEALEMLLKLAEPMGYNQVTVREALGRVLAEDIISERDIPPFNRAAMDGYAVRGEDTFGATQTNQIYFKVIGEVLTGHPEDIEVGRFEAVKITTGSPVPNGADTVVMIEYINELGDEIEVMRVTPPGNNVSLRGEDVKKGQLIIKKSRRINSQEIAMLSALGTGHIKVVKKPEVAVISTGDELIESGKKLEAGKIYDVNSFALEALSKEAGCNVDRIGILEDNYTTLKETIKALDGYDIILISGATSVGKKDVIPFIVEELGRVYVHGVAMRPGEPLGFGRIGKSIVFMLPGFPVASIVGFETFVRPLIQKFLKTHIKVPYRNIRVRLKRKISSELGRRDFVRMKVIEQKDGYSAEPLRSSGSGIVSSLVRAQGFVIVPENTEGVEQDDVVEVFLFRDIED